MSSRLGSCSYSSWEAGVGAIGHDSPRGEPSYCSKPLILGINSFGLVFEEPFLSQRGPPVFLGVVSLLPRRHGLGFWEAYSIGVGGMIGGGIFAVLGLSLLFAGFAAPVAFALSGVVAGLTSYSYARLSLRYPSAGGTVEFLVRAYGPGLLSGGLNVLLVASYIVMIALYAYAFGSYGASVLGGAEALRNLLAVGVVAGFVAVNALGAIVTGRVEDALVFFKLAVLLLVVGAGLSFVDWSRFTPSNWPGPVEVLAGGMIIFLAYEGFELIANIAADVDDVEVLPRAYYASVATVTLVYVLVALVAAGVLSPGQVIEARDYALAVAAEPALGPAGFGLVVAGALASTASAINATLYGTGGISYIVAKYGQLPKSIAKPVWKHAPEGLLVIGLLAILLVLTTPLETISTAGSGGFLIVFAAVNYAAYKLRHEARVNPAIALAALAATITSLIVLVYYMASTSPASLTVLAAMLALSFIVELAYRRATGRTYSEYIDHRLRVREELIHAWDKWVHRLVEKIVEEFRDAEVYLVGSVARRELHRAHDVDLLVVTREPPPKPRAANKVLRERSGLGPEHPVDIHYARPEEKEERLKHSRAYVKLAPRSEAQR